jgi:hypothetical protein
MKQISVRPYEVATVHPRRAGVGAALRSLFSDPGAALPGDFEALLAELDARTRCQS